MMRYLLVAACLAVSCSSSGGGKDLFSIDPGSDPATDFGPADTPQPDPGQDPGILPDVPPDTPADLVVDVPVDVPVDLATDTGPCDGTKLHGFCIRVPQMHTVPVSGMGGGTAELLDKDHVCTLEYSDLHGFLYVQATPTKVVGMGDVQYDTVGSWLSFGDVAQPAGAKYTMEHHGNDWALVTAGGKTFKYWHSSMGFGGRSCQPMDCLQVQAGPADPTLVEDGCTPERKLPIVCVEVAADGTVAPLEDHFETCMGDPILQADEGEKDVPDVPADATVSACLVWADLDKVGCKAVCAFQGGCGKCTDASQCQIDCEMVAGNGSGFKPCFTWADNDCWQAAKDAKDCDAATQCYKICY